MVQLKNVSDRDFAYWLQGFFETLDPDTVTEKQLNVIKVRLSAIRDQSSNITLVPNDFNNYPQGT